MTGSALASLSARLLAAFSTLIVATAGAARANDAPLIAAASDLKFALEEIAAVYARDTDAAVRLTFGSSGNFARQIEQGAPFELFFSADEALIARLHATGFTKDPGALYAIGRIALFAPTASPLKLDEGLEGVRALLDARQRFKFAIANPEHAPYGRAARQALERARLWQAVEPHLVLGENVSQAAQFASSDSAAGGIIAYSLAITPQLKSRGRYVLLPESMHDPLRQRMALLKGATPAAERFYRYMQSPTARGILLRYGFTLPED